MSNPYGGQEGYEYAWNEGYVHGQNHPQEEYPTAPAAFPPLDLDEQMLGYMQQVWLEGHLAGRQAGVHPEPQHQDAHGHNPVADAGHAVELVAAGVTLYHGHPVIALAEVVLTIMIPSGAPKWEQEQGELQSWFANTCSNAGWSEFFLASQWSDTQGVPPWYGNVHYQFDSALKEAKAYLQANPSSWVNVVHYRCDTPGVLEKIDVAWK